MVAKTGERYQLVEVESFTPSRTSGLHGAVHIRPRPGQGLAEDMFVECSKRPSTDYPIGIRFRIKAKVTDKEGGRPFLYSYWGWEWDVLS